ncbi:MAG: YbhB/YbcL family Raf kinase inhibitor-like protein [Patescibacteria group bacterium]
MKLSCPAFQHEGMVPPQYTCDGMDVNPPFTIEGVPEQARSLALVVDDPDAPGGDWVHWTMWNIDPSTSRIEGNTVPVGAVEGMTDFGRSGWGGPCPPSGTHRYQFKLYALDAMLSLGNTAKKRDLEEAMKGHVLAQAVLAGKYSRR